jgi:hypothetical protein
VDHYQNLNLKDSHKKPRKIAGTQADSRVDTLLQDGLAETRTDTI